MLSTSLLFSREHKLVRITTNAVWWKHEGVHWGCAIFSLAPPSVQERLLQGADAVAGPWKNESFQPSGKPVLSSESGGCWGMETWNIIHSLECRVLRVWEQVGKTRTRGARWTRGTWILLWGVRRRLMDVSRGLTWLDLSFREIIYQHCDSSSYRGDRIDVTWPPPGCR